MSRVGKKPIVLPGGVSAVVAEDRVRIEGPLGALERRIPAGLTVRCGEGRVTVEREGDLAALRALHGTIRSLLAGMAEGVSKGFQRELEIQGVGFRAQLQGSKLVLAVGYSHPVEFDLPEGIQVEVRDPQNLTVRGVDKQQVGQWAARIRSAAPAEPYKGKGIRYRNEKVRRKAGKTVA